MYFSLFLVLLFALGQTNESKGHASIASVMKFQYFWGEVNCPLVSYVKIHGPAVQSKGSRCTVMLPHGWMHLQECVQTGEMRKNMEPAGGNQTHTKVFCFFVLFLFRNTTAESLQLVVMYAGYGKRIIMLVMRHLPKLMK